MVNKEEVKHIASLARIGLTDEEVGKFSADLSSILDWMKELNEADISAAMPTEQAVGRENITRHDKIAEFENKAGITRQFPEEKNGYNKVKSVL